MDETPTAKQPVMEVHTDSARMDLPLDPTANTKVYIDASTSSLKSEMRVWFITAIVGNQLLAHVQFQSAAGYIGGGAVVAVALGAKVLSTFR